MHAIDARTRRTLVVRAGIRGTRRLAGMGAHATLLAAATIVVAATVAAMSVAAMSVTAAIAAMSIAAARLTATLLVVPVGLLPRAALTLALLRGTLLLAGVARVAHRLGTLLGDRLGERGGVGGGGLAVVLRQVTIGAVGAVIVGAIGAERGAVLTLIEAHAAIAAAATAAAAAAAAALALAAWWLVETGHCGGIENLGLGAGAGGPRGCSRGALEICYRVWGDQLRFSRQRRSARRGGGGLGGILMGHRRRDIRRACTQFADLADHQFERLDEFVLPQSATVVDLMLARQLAQILNRE